MEAGWPQEKGVSGLYGSYISQITLLLRCRCAIYDNPYWAVFRVRLCPIEFNGLHSSSAGVSSLPVPKTTHDNNICGDCMGSGNIKQDLM